MPRVLSSEPFDRICRDLELRIVEVQLARAVSLVHPVADPQHLARVGDGQVLGDVPGMPAEVLADRRALGKRLVDDRK